MSSASLQLRAVEGSGDAEAARELIGEYLRWIARLAEESYGLWFDLEAMVRSDLEDRSKFYPPNGRFYLVCYEGADVGVGCLKRLAPGVAEIQRMYLRPQARGIGAGRRLLRQLLDDAKTIGYRSIRLESLRALSAAHALYRSAGFVEIPPYAANSMEAYQPAGTLDRYRASALFMELRL
ncbi:MAG: GNAT family N-acetyltransferase [Burkholderiales bacterium]